MHAVMWVTFGGLALVYVLLCTYYLSRFFRPKERGGRRVQSLVAGAFTFGWVLAVAEHLKLCPDWLEASMLALAYTVGGVALLIICVSEFQKERPFR